MSLYYPLSACNLFKSIEVCQVYILCLYQYKLKQHEKILVLFALLMTGVMGIHAQEGLKWGAMAGMNSSKFSTNGFDSKVGFHVGIKAEKDLPQIAQGVYLDMAALLSLKVHK